MKPIIDFAKKVRAERFSLNADLMTEKGGRYFLLNEKLKSVIQKDFFYAGVYLGKAKDGRFFPSFNLLAMMAECGANSVVVNKKAAWLFICGRDIFARGITSVHGSCRKGDFTLVLNGFGECLGFGRIARDLDSEAKKNEVAVRNVSDVGDFLRREGKTR